MMLVSYSADTTDSKQIHRNKGSVVVKVRDLIFIQQSRTEIIWKFSVNMTV